MRAAAVLVLVFDFAAFFVGAEAFEGVVLLRVFDRTVISVFAGDFGVDLEAAGVFDVLPFWFEAK